ncbi:hypothetical protein BGZ96_004560 [Linnemannia gamsii]|uniref:Uncharacterized protein n=1 Tax=Linnemannia gamsii TaxID=64522 RepID=A0ABQ7K678_9FUNG|nr:hypothetical protein BGZ96_004560 [Linnemannia gamsii]
MKITTTLTVLAAIVFVQVAPFASSIPLGGGGRESTSSLPSNNPIFEKRTTAVGNSALSARGYDSQSLGNSNYDLRKRRDPSPSSIYTNSRNVKREGYNPWDPQSGYEGYESSGNIRRRHDHIVSSVDRTVKRDKGYDPKIPQTKDRDSGGGGGDLRRRSNRSSSSSLKKRGYGLDPVDPFEVAVTHEDSDLKKREEAVMGLET